VRSRSASLAQTPAGVDLGPPVSYLTLKDGAPVYDRRGRRIGVVDEVAADTALDIFDGLIIHTEPLPGRHVFASVDRIAELHERGVLLSVESNALPPAGPAHAGDDQDEAPAEGKLHALVRRTWDRINGR
jgi:hypothetical protein